MLGSRGQPGLRKVGLGWTVSRAVPLGQAIGAIGEAIDGLVAEPAKPLLVEMETPLAFVPLAEEHLSARMSCGLVTS